MVHISIRVGDELANQLGEALNEFHYKTRTQFLNEAIRHKLKELRMERKKEEAWHKLLSSQRPREMVKRTWASGKTMMKKIRGPRFTLKDFLRNKHEFEYE